MLHCIQKHTLSRLVYKHGPEKKESWHDVPTGGEASDEKILPEQSSRALPEKFDVERPLAPEIVKVQQETRFSIIRFLKNVLLHPTQKAMGWIRKNTLGRIT